VLVYSHLRLGHHGRRDQLRIPGQSMGRGVLPDRQDQDSYWDGLIKSSQVL